MLRSHLIKAPQALSPAASSVEPEQGERWTWLHPGRSSRRRALDTKVKRTVGVLLALLALGLASAATAQAASTDNLGWKVNGKALGESETATITAQAEGTQVFKGNPTVLIECSKLELQGGKLVGSKSPAPGKAEGKIAYSGCVLQPYECIVTGVSKPLVATNVYLTKAAAEKEEIAAGLNGMLLAPKEGEVFVEFVVSKPKSGFCPPEKPITLPFTGNVLARVAKGSKETVYNEEAQTHVIEGSTQKTYFENEGGKTVEHSGVGLKTGAMEASWSGKVGLSVAAGSKFNLAL
jgi:hypothetical protein